MARTSEKSGATAAPRPAKQRFGQIRQVYSLAVQDDPRLPFVLLGVVLAAVALGALIGWPFGHPVYGAFVALPLGVLAAFYLLSRKAERAAYGAIEGRPGAAGAVLQGLRRGWSYGEEPVAVEGGRGRSLQDAAMVFRAVGRPGVVLVAEGPAARAQKLLVGEKRKVARLTPNVPVHLYRLGQPGTGPGAGEEVLEPRDVVRRMQKLPNTLTATEVTEVDRRLRALGAQRPPIPQGMDPNRMRGRGRGGMPR